MIDNTARNLAIVRLRQAGEGPRHIARVLSLSPGTVAGVLTRAGLCSWTGGGRGNRVPHAMRQAIIRDAQASGENAAAQRWGLHRATVNRFVREAA